MGEGPRPGLTAPAPPGSVIAMSHFARMIGLLLMGPAL